MTELQPIQGLTPGILWTTLVGLFALLLIFLSVAKLVEFIQKQKDRKARQDLNNGGSLTDDIADKVMKKLEPKFDQIDKKLSADKERLDSHELRLNEQDKSLKKISMDTAQIMDVLDGMLMHFITGNHQEQLREVKADLDRYKNSR